MKKRLYIILSVIIIIFILFFAFYEHIMYFICKKTYDNLKVTEQVLTYNKETRSISENSITKNNLKIILSKLEYNENQLDIEFKFSHLDNQTSINNVGYVLRVYNEDYFLGNRYIGTLTSSNNSTVTFNNIFYEINFNNDTTKNLSNYTTVIPQIEILEDENALLQRLAFTLPENFIITDSLNVILFDMNYQNIGDKTFYKVDDTLSEIKYLITFQNYSN